jgi:hypothetical protein
VVDDREAAQRPLLSIWCLISPTMLSAIRFNQAVKSADLFNRAGDKRRHL